MDEQVASQSFGTLDLSEEKDKSLLVEGLKCYELDLHQSNITSYPENVQVDYRINLADCKQLETLPDNLKTGTLILSGCTNLKRLPENLSVHYLDISECSQLTEWPEQGQLRFGRLIARNCSQLTYLPEWLEKVSQLDLSGCSSLKNLPDKLQVSSWIDIAHSGITSRPSSISESQLRWSGVPITDRIAFCPEQISSQEILAEPNAELRRVMLERVGFERFFEAVDAKVLDADQDPGGERKLLLVPMENDEDLVCVSVNCPSTDRRYIIRVPPDMKTCHQAIAWTAGFDNPDDYHPLIET